MFSGGGGGGALSLLSLLADLAFARALDLALAAVRALAPIALALAPILPPLRINLRFLKRLRRF